VANKKPGEKVLKSLRGAVLTISLADPLEEKKRFRAWRRRFMDIKNHSGRKKDSFI